LCCSSLIRYREWYGASAANVGLKLPAEEVADGIKDRERSEPRNSEGRPAINYGVLDPSAFASDGGPSIAERTAKRGVIDALITHGFHIAVPWADGIRCAPD
jgi:hypothetical protein